jgi:hypothetical protein
MGTVTTMNKPKILLFDIETSPNIGYTWGKWEQDIIAFTEHWHLLCFAAKWLGQKKVFAYGLPDFKDYVPGKIDDTLLVVELWKLFDEADVIVAHNGDQFDVKKANSLFVRYGLNPPRPYVTIDTKKVAKRYFRFDSNKLDDLGQELGLGRKIQTGGFDLWQGCMAGDSRAWKKMIAYNKQDVVLLEKVYLRLRKWMTNHPNHNAFEERTTLCPNCGSENMQHRGFSVTRTGKKERYQCQSCGAWSYGKSETLKGILK